VELHNQPWNFEIRSVNVGDDTHILLVIPTLRTSSDLHLGITHHFPVSRTGLGKMDVVLSGKTLLKIARIQRGSEINDER